MEILQFQSCDYQEVIRIRDKTFNEINLNAFIWQPCQQIESLQKDCANYVYRDAAIKGYVAAYGLDDTHFRLNLIVDPNHTNQGIGTFLLSKIEFETKKMGGKYLQARLLEHMVSSLIFRFPEALQKSIECAGCLYMRMIFLIENGGNWGRS